MSIIDKVKSYINPGTETIEKGTTDEELVQKIEDLYRLARTKKKDQFEYYKTNKKFYMGDHWSMKRPTYKSDVVENRIFSAIEQIVPMMTDRQPRLNVERIKSYGDEQRDEEADLQTKICEKMLGYHWDRLKMSLMTPQIVRNMYLYRDCILHWFWNYWEDDVDVEIMNPYHFYLDPKATSMDDAEYVIKRVPRSIKQIMDMKNEGVYKNITKEDLRIHTGSEAYENNDDNDNDDKYGDTKKDRENLIDVKEFWGYVDSGDKYEMKVITVIAGKIVRNEKDPNFDYEEEETETAREDINSGENIIPETMPVEPAEETDSTITGAGPMEGYENIQTEAEPMPEEPKSHNHFRRPRLPFIIIPTYQTGESAFSITSSIEQAAKLQENINKRKAQISDNADLINNAPWLIDAKSGIETWQLKQNKPNLIVKGNDVSPSHIRRDRPPGLPEFIFSDLEHSEREFDNVFGTHDVSRGVQIGVKSATEAQLLKEADQGRPALMTKLFESGIEELGNAWLQLMKVHYTEDHYGKALTDEETEKYFSLTRDDIPDDVEVKVKVGSTLPIDRVARRQESQEMFRMGLLGPVTTYNRLEDINKPFETAQELQGWARDMSLPGDPPPMPEGMPPEGELMPGEESAPEEEELPASLDEDELEAERIERDL